MSQESHHTDTQAAVDAGIATAVPAPIEPGAGYVVALPAGAHHSIVRLAYDPVHDAAPERARGAYRPATVEAFIQTVARHHSETGTTIWVHPENGRIVAVFNDAHPKTGPGWRDHRAELTLRHTPEWNHWLAKDGQLLSQQQFAEHIENGVGELVTPPAAEMLELAQTFHATTNATFRQATRLQDGQIQAQYDEEVEARAGRAGQLQIPPVFELAVAPFIGEDPWKLTARLRYRVQGGDLKLGYKLDRPHQVINAVLRGITESLADRFPSVVVGEPAS